MTGMYLVRAMNEHGKDEAEGQDEKPSKHLHPVVDPLQHVRTSHVKTAAG